MTQPSTPPTPTQPSDFAIERFALRLIVRSLVALLLLAAAAYPVDFAIWRIRVAHSPDGRGGMDTVLVSRFTVAELKGGKEDYYPEGTTVIDCSRTLYPQGGNAACWWLRRHSEVIQKY